MLLLSKLNYRGDWYLLRAKFTNDWNFFVREVGRGSGMEERSLEIGNCLLCFFGKILMMMTMMMTTTATILQHVPVYR